MTVLHFGVFALWLFKLKYFIASQYDFHNFPFVISG